MPLISITIDTTCIDYRFIPNSRWPCMWTLDHGLRRCYLNYSLLLHFRFLMWIEYIHNLSLVSYFEGYHILLHSMHCAGPKIMQRVEERKWMKKMLMSLTLQVQIEWFIPESSTQHRPVKQPTYWASGLGKMASLYTKLHLVSWCIAKCEKRTLKLNGNSSILILWWWTNALWLP